MEDLIVECDVEDIDRIRLLPGFDAVYHYHEDEMKKTHPCEYGKMKIGSIVFRFRVYREDPKTRVLDCLGTVCHHLGMIRKHISDEDTSQQIYDLNKYIQQTIQAYV